MQQPQMVPMQQVQMVPVVGVQMVPIQQQQMMMTQQNPQMQATSAQVAPLQDVCQVSMADGCHQAEGKIEMTRDVTDVPVEELRPVFATCCSICSLFCGFPSCIGCTGSTACFCLLCKYTYCKLLDCKDEDKRCCACDNCNCYLTYPNKIYECTGQYCFLDVRAAFPCTSKVPCLVTLCGVTCCAQYKCKPGVCKKIGESIPELMERAGKA